MVKYNGGESSRKIGCWTYCMAATGGMFVAGDNVLRRHHNLCSLWSHGGQSLHRYEELRTPGRMALSTPIAF